MRTFILWLLLALTSGAQAAYTSDDYLREVQGCGMQSVALKACGIGPGSDVSFGTITATTGFIAPTGSNTAPTYSFAGAATVGMYNAGSGYVGLTGGNGFQAFAGTTGVLWVNTSNLQVPSTSAFAFSSGAITSTSDIVMLRAGANSLQIGQTSATTTARTELNKAVASIADATPTAVLTITVPNAAHSASVRVRVTGSLGAGGAIGANEATAVNEYIVVITRTAGVNATAAISTAYGSAATAVAGAATVTATAAMSAVSGAVGATNTFTVNVTITRSGGSSTNHTCLVYAQLMNANATGVTIS